MNSETETLQAIQRKLTAELKKIVEQLPCDIATIHVYDEENRSLEFPIGYNLNDESSFFDSRLAPRVDRVAGSTAAQGVEIFADDIEGTELDGPFARREQVRSAAGVPLRDADMKIGALFISYRRRHLFSDSERKQIRAHALRLAKQIQQLTLLELIHLDRTRQSVEDTGPFKTIVNLASNVLDAAVALWARSRDGHKITILDATQLPAAYLKSDTVDLDSEDVLARVFRNNEHIYLTELLDQPRYSPFIESHDLASLLAFPIKMPNRCEGVLDIVTLRARSASESTLDMESTLDTVRYIAQMAGWALDAQRQAKQSDLFEKVVARLRAQPEIDQIMDGVMDAARQLTGADSAAIILRDLDDQEFVVAYRAPKENSPRMVPRSEGGMTAKIIQSGKPILVSDNRKESRVAKTLHEQGFLSMAGVAIELHGERFGALYVDSRNVGQFDQADVERLQLLAAHASTSLGWSRKLLRPYEEIEKATSELSHLDSIVHEVCEAACEEYQYDFATVNLIRPVENIIETVGGSGIGKEWVGLARHYLHEDLELRDVQADIVLSRPWRLEILSGWDDRFDRWIYERYGHDQIVRIIIPLLLVRVSEQGDLDHLSDQEDRVVDDWATYSSLNKKSDVRTKDGRRTDYQITIRHPDSLDLESQVIGTLEVGYKCPKRSLGQQEAEALLPFTARAAAQIYQAQLPSILLTVLKSARRIVRASSASLHLYRRTSEEQPRVHYIHEVTAGNIKKSWLEQYPPRPKGLGARAHEVGHALVIPNRSEGHAEDQLRELNPGIWKAGIRTIIALPLIVREEQRIRRAVLYLHFRRVRWIQDDELGWLQLFTRRAADAIQKAALFERTRDRASQFEAIQAVAQGLSTNVPEGGLLREIANNMLNIIAADVITIYEYDHDQFLEKEKRFIFPPETAGRLLEQQHMQTSVKGGDSPTLLVDHCLQMAEAKGELEGPLLHFAPDVRDDPVFLPESREPREPNQEPFIERERIRSAAGLLLRVRSEIVGVLFVNYRRTLNELTDHEVSLLKSLAATAAISIKNRRMLEALGAGGRETVNLNQPEKLLTNTVERAVQLTRADLGYVRLLDPNGKLVLSAHHPPDIDLANHIELGEGLSGWVAKERRSLLIEDTQTSPLRIDAELRIRSALCLPLLGEERHLMGVLGVGSFRSKAFSSANQWLLRGLADDATLALVQADQHRQLVATESMAIFGELAGDFWHLAGNGVGFIKLQTKRILAEDRIQESAHEILERSEQILDSARRLKSASLDPKHAVRLEEVVKKALGKVSKPSHIEVSTEFPPNLPSVSGGEVQLQGIFFNFIENAYRAMPETFPGRLEIRAVEQEFVGRSYVIVTVKDNGIGIPAKNVERIFDPGFGTSSGLGHGLWLSKMYIDRSHGRIEVNSTEGSGTQFRLWLPCFESVSERAEAPHGSA